MKPNINLLNGGFNLNLNMFSAEDFEDGNIVENFSKKCQLINEFNSLIDMINNQDLFEYSLIENKTMSTNFIRCLDFFHDGIYFFVNIRYYNIY